jgi:hypothetical protein
MASAEGVQRFARGLCEVAGVKPLGEAQTPCFGAADKRSQLGLLVQFTETGSITGHLSRGTKAAYINLFSSKPFELEKVEAYTREWFRAKRMNSRYLVRN